GYPTRMVDKFVGNRLKFDEKVAPPRFRLAVTAALEHYTATLAELLLSDPNAQAAFGDTDEVRNLLLWHAVEESEHKAVAFDVFQAVCGSQKLRARVMNAVTVGFIGTSVLFTAISLMKDPASRDLRRLGKSLWAIRKSPWLTKAVRHRIRDYNRPDFHPDDHDATELLTEWRARLFGTDGTLVDHLASA
ncbi:MAG TPA: metal-dependent hydrolase, partial [Acidimicrobiales bacterium]